MHPKSDRAKAALRNIKAESKMSVKLTLGAVFTNPLVRGANALSKPDIQF